MPETDSEKEKLRGNDAGRVAVVSGGSIDPSLADYILHEKRYSYIIAADRGLVFLESHGAVPDLIVGDFDSSPDDFIQKYRSAHPDVEVRTYKPEKDYTDTEIAVTAALEKGYLAIDIFGGTGTRLDHVLGNLQVLSEMLDQGAEGYLIDSHNRISLHNHSFSLRKEEQWGHYVSLFAWGGPLGHLTLRGVHYPLTDALLPISGSLGVSNEIDEDEAHITFPGGRVLLVESRD